MCGIQYSKKIVQYFKQTVWFCPAHLAFAEMATCMQAQAGRFAMAGGARPAQGE